MAADIGIPPWLNRSADPASYFLPARHEAWNEIGEMARIQQASAALAESARRTDMELQMERERSQAEQNVKQQQLEIAKAYHDSETGLQVQKLEEAKRMNSMRIQQFAQSAAAKQEYQQRVASGEDPAKVGLELGPRMGVPGSGLASLVRAGQAEIPPTLQTQTVDGQTYYQSGRRPWMHIQQPKAGTQAMDPFDKKALDAAYKSYEEAEKLAQTASGKVRENALRDKDLALRRINNIRWGHQGESPAPATPTTDTQPTKKITIERDPNTGKLVVPGLRPQEEKPAAPKPSSIKALMKFLDDHPDLKAPFGKITGGIDNPLAYIPPQWSQ